MSHDPCVADRTIEDFLQALASDGATPGSGAAAAVALALAAACGGKAVAVSLKHRPDNATLLQNQTRLTDIALRALAGADEDASRFAEFVHDKDASSSERLTRAEQGMQILADELVVALRDVRDHVVPAVAGDIVAAAALRQAALAIEAENLAETRTRPAGEPNR